MSKKSLSISLALLIAACCLTGCKKQDTASTKNVVLYENGMSYTESATRETKPVYALTYEIMGGEDVMPIGGFYVPYASGGSDDGNDKPDLLTDYYFQALADCGINMFFYSPDRWNKGGANTSLNTALDLCEKYGIGYYIDTYWVSSQMGTRAEKYPTEDMIMSTESGKQEFVELINEITKNGSRKSVIGIMGIDEPFTEQLANLGVLHDVFYSLENTTGLDIFINSIGYWAGENNFWGYSEPIAFASYMERYFDIVKPAMLSVTQYPFTSVNTPETTVVSLLNDMLSVYRKLANDNGVPFWRMLQAGGQWNDSAEWIESEDPYPSEGELLYDVNSSLAYGAKAINYFPLVQPYYFAQATGGTYDFENRNGLIGADGNLTRWYYYAKRANTQIKAIDEYLMHATNEGVIIHGDSAYNAIVTNGKSGDEIIKTESFEQLKKIAGDDCVVGCFNYKGKTALYVVNYNRKAKANISLAFDDDNYKYTVVQRGKSADVVGGRIPLTLDAGEGALIVLA